MDMFERFDQNQAMEILQQVVIAAIILVITWVLAKAAKWAFAKLVDKIGILQRNTGTGTSIGESLGRIVSLFIWLFGLLAILQVFDLGGVMSPIQGLLNNIMDVVPDLIGAALVFFIGIMVAGIVRDLVVTALQTVDFDRWVNRGGAETATGNARISKTIGTIIYALIVIVVSIAALNILDIEAISVPASNMLNMILAAIPNIIGAAILLAIGYVVSRFVVQILKEVLTGFGVDRSVAATGLVGETTQVSSIIARVVQVAILLFFAIAATRLLGFPELTELLNTILEVGAKVIFGAVIIGVGFLIANLLSRIIAGESGESLAASIVKWATIVVFVFMGLSQMDLGEGIIELAFGALVIGGGVAGALAFGLGGREWAGRKLEELDEAAKARSTGTGGSAPKVAKPAKTPSAKAASKSDKPLPPGA